MRVLMRRDSLKELHKSKRRLEEMRRLAMEKIEAQYDKPLQCIAAAIEAIEQLQAMPRSQADQIVSLVQSLLAVATEDWTALASEFPIDPNSASA